MRKKAVDMMDVEEQQVDEKTAAENRQFSNNSVVIIMAVIFSVYYAHYRSFVIIGCKLQEYTLTLHVCIYAPIKKS